MEIKIPGVQLLRKRSDRRDPISASTERRLPTTIIVNNIWKVSPQQAAQSGIDDHAWSSQEWKTDTEMCERPGRPDVTSWRATRESQLGFSHEETHHDGTAQSVVSEVIPRERSGRPDINSQGGAWPQHFVIGNDEAELILSVESRSFLSTVNDQVRKKTDNDLVNVHGLNNGISGIHGKELPKQLSIHCEHNRSHTQTNVRHIHKIGV